MLKPIRRLIRAGSLLALTAILFALAKYLPMFWFPFYTDASRSVLTAIGTVTGVLPFCLWEILLLGLLVWGLVSLILSLKSKRIVCWLTGVLEVLSLLLFLFVALWGLNHFGPTAAQKLELEVREYTVEELKGATAYYAAMADRYADKVPREADDSLKLPDFRTLSKQAAADARAMPQPLFHAAAGSVKPLLSSRLFSYMGITGIFLDLTAESCVNTETYAPSLPYTMCHELSHSCAISAEDDANYCSFLICEHSDDVLFRYSGYYSAYLYCYNALFQKDAAAASAIYTSCGELLQQDCDGAVTYYDQFEGPAQELATKANDTYLKTFGEEKGVQSYGAVTDMLIAHWLTLQAG